MSAIDELKNGINIDATNESEDNVSVELGNSGGVVIDSTDDNFEDRVDLSASIKQQTKPKTKVMPKNSASNTQPIPNNTAARQTVEISAIAEDEEDEVVPINPNEFNEFLSEQAERKRKIVNF